MISWSLFASGKHLRAKMTSSNLHLYHKKQEWWGILQSAIIWVTMNSKSTNVNFYQELVYSKIYFKNVYFLNK